MADQKPKTHVFDAATTAHLQRQVESIETASATTAHLKVAFGVSSPTPAPTPTAPPSPPPVAGSAKKGG